MTRYDAVVVGGGIVGLATAREILVRRPGSAVAVLEKEPHVGQHQTGHSSGVIHSGLYYEPGSLKARLCVLGARELYDFCADKAVPVEQCGKVVVATSASELPALRQLYERGQANGVAGLRLVDPVELLELEPHTQGLQAIHSPTTGIVDFTRVAQALADDVARLGGVVSTGRLVTGLRDEPGGSVVETWAGELHASRVITCGGLQSDRLARLSGSPGEPSVVPFRGAYWQLRLERRHLVRALIYPVPDPALPFLGVHLTRRINDGAVWLGPNAVLALSREGYRRRDVRLADLRQVLTSPAMRRLAARHWRTGVAEVLRDLSKKAFVASCRRLLPELQDDDVVAGPSGVRAQAVAADGSLVDDFAVDVQGPRYLHVRNAPSPAATSSLALARVIVDRWEQAR
ncbi:L-2-hydroxyglutarate oxidase [Acidothermaceae bacterium B102]|nr:L-2-hydroxyglutarate oxidase [Acidothermaceae bacterium B102]